MIQKKNPASLTEGSIVRGLLGFAVPLFLGQLLQQLYNMADAWVVGNFAENDAFAAVSMASHISFLIIGFFNGIAIGGGVVISRYFGAKNERETELAIHTNFLFGIGASVLSTIAGVLLVPRLLVWMHTPESVMPHALVYFRIYFGGVSTIIMYNICMAIMRALGDSLHPLYYLVISSCLNVALDLLFVAGFHWGVGGAAVATVIAQGFSALYCLIVLRKIPDIRLEKKDFYRQPSMSLRLLELAAPLAIQNVIISVGGLVVQYVINGFGFLFVAGFTASNKLYGVLEMAAVSYGYAITTYVGQNLGAKKYQRIRKGVRSGTYMAVLTSAFISGMMVLFGRNVLSLFVSGEPDQTRQVLDIAYKYLFIMAVFLWVLYLLYVYRSAIQGLGNTLIPLASGIAEFIMRVSVALLLPKLIGEDGIYYAEICAWSSAAVLLFVSYMIIIRKYKEVTVHT